MESVKRGRGRPKGTGDDDSGPLLAVARALLGDPERKATTAMKAVLRTRRDWKAASDEALIRRWQGKWRTDKAVYLQRVQNERAEAERQRREREAAQARRVSSGTARELMAEALAAGHAPGWALQKTMRGWAAQNALTTRTAGEWLAIANTMPKMTLSRADVLASAGLAGWTMSDAMRSVLKTANVTGLSAAMQKHGILGLTADHAGVIANMPKLPKGF